MKYPVAEVIGCHIWPADSVLPIAIDPLVLDFGGPIGDRHYGLTMKSDVRQSKHFPKGTEIRNHRQISIVEATELQDVAATLGITEVIFTPVESALRKRDKAYEVSYDSNGDVNCVKVLRW